MYRTRPRLRSTRADEHHSPPGGARGGLSNETFDVHGSNLLWKKECLKQKLDWQKC